PDVRIIWPELPAAAGITFELIDIQHRSNSDLAKVVNTGGLFRLHLGLSQGRKQHRGENGNDRDHDQQLNECKGAVSFGRHAAVWGSQFHTLRTFYATELWPVFQSGYNPKSPRTIGHVA